MKIIKKVIALMIYLMILSFLLEFNMMKLFQVRQFIMVLAGMVILYLPTLQVKDKNHIQLQILGECALYASLIQTFILCFSSLSTIKNFEDISLAIALNIRPLLYGLCVLTILSGIEENQQKSKADNSNRGQENEEKENIKKEITAIESYYYFIELGLTRREAEVGLRVCQGLSNKEIAEELTISETTVKKHMSNIFEKLNLNKREQLYEKLIEKKKE